MYKFSKNIEKSSGKYADISDKYADVFLIRRYTIGYQLFTRSSISRKENIKKAIDEKTFVLLICGGYQLFGQYYIVANNEKISGLQFYDYYTDTGKAGSRCIGNCCD